jgi:hypothetical protein
MTAMQIPARSEGRKAMEDSLTTAEKVRRQLKAGRKRKTSVLPSLLDAVQRLSDESVRARGLMLQYGLVPDDIRVALLCRAIVPGMPLIKRAPLPAPGSIGTFITELEKMSQMTRVDFLGILWEQVDRDPRAKMPLVVWVTEFADDKQATLDMLTHIRSKRSPSAAN